MDTSFTPQTKVAWLTSILLSVLLYCLYYLFFYPFVRNAYNQQFQNVAFSTCEDLGPVNAGESQCSKSFIVNFYFPRNLDDSSGQPIVVKIQNISSVDFEGQWNLDLLPLEKDSNTDANFTDFEEFVVPLLITENTTELQNVKLSIKANHPYYFRLVFPYPGTILKNRHFTPELSLKSDDGRIKYKYLPESDFGSLQINSLNSTLYVVVEKVLLPPWANILIPILATFSVWLLENRVKITDNDITAEDFGRLFFPSLMVSLIIVATWYIGIATNSILLLLLFPLLIVGYWQYWRLHQEKSEKIKSMLEKLKCGGSARNLYLLFLVIVTVALFIEKLPFALDYRNRKINHQDAPWEITTIALLIMFLLLGAILIFHAYKNKEFLKTSSEDVKEKSNSTKSKLARDQNFTASNKWMQNQTKKIDEILTHIKSSPQSDSLQISEITNTLTAIQNVIQLLSEKNSKQPLSLGVKELTEKMDEILVHLNTGSQDDEQQTSKIANALTAIHNEIQLLSEKILRQPPKEVAQSFDAKADLIIDEFKKQLLAHGYKECSNCGNHRVPNDAIHCHQCGNKFS